MTDQELARRAQEGDADAFVSLIHRYHLPLYRLAYRFAGSAEGAEDLCQEILMRAFRQIRKYDTSRPFQNWLMRVASNVSLNWNESHAKRKEAEIALTDEMRLPAESDVEKEVMDRIDRQDVLKALGTLPKDVRLLLILRFSLGLSLREVADQTGIKLPTVAVRLTRGVESLRKALAPGVEVFEG